MDTIPIKAALIMSAAARGLVIRISGRSAPEANSAAADDPELKGAIAQASRELARLLGACEAKELPGPFCSLPNDFQELRQVELGGELDEPTLAPEFQRLVEALLHVRALRPSAFFKFVLLTNGTGLHLPAVRSALELLTGRDEIWASLSAGTQEWLDTMHGPVLDLDQITRNLIATGQSRPITVRSMFPLVDGNPPTPAEILHYILRLQHIRSQNVVISSVQIFSQKRSHLRPRWDHLPLKALSAIAAQVRRETGLAVEVF